jgi:hypothetical protein
MHMQNKLFLCSLSSSSHDKQSDCVSQFQGLDYDLYRWEQGYGCIFAGRFSGNASEGTRL